MYIYMYVPIHVAIYTKRGRERESFPSCGLSLYPTRLLLWTSILYSTDGVYLYMYICIYTFTHTYFHTYIYIYALTLAVGPEVRLLTFFPQIFGTLQCPYTMKVLIQHGAEQSGAEQSGTEQGTVKYRMPPRGSFLVLLAPFLKVLSQSCE